MTDYQGMVTRGMPIAAIDLGTVSSRLLLAEIREKRVVGVRKRTIITDLGERVDATGLISEAAIERVVGACRGFVDEIRDFGAVAVCTTLTSAARDAANGEALLAPLRELGLAPQVIPGEVEARLTFLGVAHDFPSELIAVADSGGGSTEVAVGRYDEDARRLELERARSLDIGCRRLTERFLPGDPPAEDDIDRAAAWAFEEFSPVWGSLSVSGAKLIAVGGTVTTLVAMTHELEPYDSSFVHLHELTADEVDLCIERMRGLSVEGIRRLKGVQPKRAHVILAGAIVIRELMRVAGYERLTVSENSILAGLASTIAEVLAGDPTTISWVPELSR